MTHYFPFRFMNALRSIFMMTIYRYIPFAVVTIPFSFSFSWLITRIWIRVARLVPLLEHEMLILPEHLSSPPVLSGVRVARSLVFCVMFCRSLFVLLSFCSLYCLFFDILWWWLLITPVVFSNFFDNHPNSLICPRDTRIHLK